MAALATELATLTAQLEEGGDDLDRVVERFADVEARYSELGGYQLEGRANAILAGLGFAPEKIGDADLKAVVAWMLNLVIVPVAAFYLLRDWNLLVERIHALLPRHIEPVVVRLVRESDETLGAFLRGQLSVMIILGMLYGVGLWAVGISVGPLIGMIAGLISFVPYLGAIVGVAMGVIAALVQYQDAFHVAMVLVVFASGQLLEGYVLVPKLVGDRIGLHPVAVMFAILAGGELFGFVGVLVALPLAAVIMVLLRYAYQRYTQSEMYQEPPADSTIVLEGSVADSVRVAKGEAESTPKSAAATEPDKPA